MTNLSYILYIYLSVDVVWSDSPLLYSCTNCCNMHVYHHDEHDITTELYIIISIYSNTVY